MTRYNTFMLDGELYVERKYDGFEWETLPIEQVYYDKHTHEARYEITFYGMREWACTVYDAIEAYEAMERIHNAA